MPIGVWQVSHDESLVFRRDCCRCTIGEFRPEPECWEDPPECWRRREPSHDTPPGERAWLSLHSWR